MGDTKIEWADRVWNPVTGCSRVSPGCRHCYAERMARRLAGRYGYPAGDGFAVTLHPGRLNEPVMWRKPSRIFVGSMGDLFHEAVDDGDLLDIWIAMAISQQHRFLVLTKRPDRMASFVKGLTTAGGLPHNVFADDMWPVPNIWLGVTVCNQDEADAKLPVLLSIPARGHFVSIEPMLGSVDLGGMLQDHEWEHGVPGGLAWIIAGGENGPGARPAHPDWFRSLRDQCAAAGVPFFFKGQGEWADNIDGASCYFHNRHANGGNCRVVAGTNMFRVGRKAAGHLLDGVLHHEIPAALLERYK